MNASVSDTALLAMWITFTVLGTAGLAAVLVWAVRGGQFRDQDRMRRLPLESPALQGNADESNVVGGMAADVCRHADTQANKQVDEKCSG